MTDKRLDDALWFEHEKGYRLYPWYRQSAHHGRSAFWVSDGSNLIKDADPVDSVEELIAHVFQRKRSIWLRANGTPALSGLYRVGERALKGWGAAPNLKPLIEAALGRVLVSAGTPGSIDDLTDHDYRRAIQAAQLTDSQLAWLIAHARRADGKASMRQLSGDVGHKDWETANLHYGRVAGRIAGNLSHPPAYLEGERPTQNMPWIAQHLGKGDDGEAVWQMLPQVRVALGSESGPESLLSDSIGSRLIRRATGTNPTRASLPILVEKAIRDAGFDLISAAADDGYYAGASGLTGRIWLKPEGEGAWVALPLEGAQRLGLEDVDSKPVPAGMSTIGRASSARSLYGALHAARVRLANAPTSLSARVEARLAAIPATERTREVRQRIGQDVFREALFEMWNGCCAISGLRLPQCLLRASHAKPWADANDDERLDPFNGLLLAVHYDALFDAGLLAVTDIGKVLVSPDLNDDARRAMGLVPGLHVIGLRPGHVPDLTYHRSKLAQWTESSDKCTG